MDYLPIFVKAEGRRCLVVGGGQVGLRKTRQLLAAKADVTVLSPELCEALDDLVRDGRVRYRPGVFTPAALDGFLLVIAATADATVNAAVYAAASRRQMLVNVVDDPDHCSFITPAVVDRSPIVVAISSGGAAPVLARKIRAWLETTLPVRTGALAALARRFRDRVKAALGSLAERRRFWEGVFDGAVADHVYAGRDRDAERALEEQLARAATTGPPQGQVSLVGAGPGDPSLLTLRALQVMQEADVVLHDRLVAQPILDLARRDADFVSVGKAPGDHSHSQAAINDLLVRHARAGRRVVRLKGGDPFIFGRGGEELEALAAAGIDFQVVPGITAAAACAAYAGVPLTHRALSQSVRFVTAHCARSLDCLDWRALAADRQTLAFYMGVKQAGEVARQLMAHGRAPDTPFAIVENGTRPGQRVLTGTIAGLDATIRLKKVVSPSIIIVGEVAALATELGWYSPTAAADPTPDAPVALAAAG